MPLSNMRKDIAYYRKIRLIGILDVFGELFIKNDLGILSFLMSKKKGML